MTVFYFTVRGFPFPRIKSIAYIKTGQNEMQNKSLIPWKMFHLMIMHFKQESFMHGMEKNKKQLKN